MNNIFLYLKCSLFREINSDKKNVCNLVWLECIACFQLGVLWVTEMAVISENKRNNGNNCSSGTNAGAQRTLATTLIVGTEVYSQALSRK